MDVLRPIICTRLSARQKARLLRADRVGEAPQRHVTLVPLRAVDVNLEIEPRLRPRVRYTDDARRRVQRLPGEEDRRPAANHKTPEQGDAASERTVGIEGVKRLGDVAQQLQAIVREQRLHLLRREHRPPAEACLIPRRERLTDPRQPGCIHDVLVVVLPRVHVPAVVEQHLVGYALPRADRPELRHPAGRGKLAAVLEADLAPHAVAGGEAEPPAGAPRPLSHGERADPLLGLSSNRPLLGSHLLAYRQRFCRLQPHLLRLPGSPPRRSTPL
mmetsp:Transcript_15748/g.51565  ORF Transcript_15748/g.51565 Transcript_15748/m.51565 type:complete len:273 (+) Transcript_15748:1015-1833(+)